MNISLIYFKHTDILTLKSGQSGEERGEKVTQEVLNFLVKELMIRRIKK